MPDSGAPGPVREPVTLRAKGDAREGSAEVVRYSLTGRRVKGGIYLGAGITGGAVFIIVPVLHLCTTWALPLAGLVACIVTLRTELRMRKVSGPCPACGEEIGLGGGAGGLVSEWCPRCKVPIQISLGYDGV